MALSILHVDDDENIRALTALAFSLTGDAEVRSAGSGAEAMEALAGGLQPDLILLDVMMPDMDGPAVLNGLRQLPAHRKTPVIFMTAQTQEHELARLMALGASGVVIKPFDPMTLGHQVRALIEDWPVTDPLEPLRTLFVARCGGDLEQLRGLDADDPAVGPIAHQLAGSAGSFGFPEISEAAAIVDDRARHSPPPRPEDVQTLIRLLEEAVARLTPG